MTVEQFMAAHGLSASGIDIESVLEDFRSEMEKGLAGEESSLEMIPTFIAVDKPLPADQPVIALDAGGTNLRVATVVFNEAGESTTSDYNKYQMPGIDVELSASDFFGKFAQYLEPVQEKSPDIGFCFSYPAEITPERDGKLIRWTKEVKVPEVVGEYIGKGVLDAMGEAGEGKSITILNDTIATLLAGKAAGDAAGCQSYIGFILGTGTNMAYVEKNSNVTKRDDLDVDGSQAINVESGNFALAPRGDVDLALDADTEQPGVHTFEKMISGLYMGELVLRALKLAGDESLLSEGCAAVVNGIDELTAKEVDFFLLDKPEGVLSSDAVTLEDKAVIKEIMTGVYKRAAKLTAINISAAVLKSGAGVSAPICINIDGTTYYKAVGFKDMTEDYLKEILGSRGISYELFHADEAPLMGAAIAGLTG